MISRGPLRVEAFRSVDASYPFVLIDVNQLVDQDIEVLPGVPPIAGQIDRVEACEGAIPSQPKPQAKQPALRHTHIPPAQRGGPQDTRGNRDLGACERRHVGRGPPEEVQQLGQADEVQQPRDERRQPTSGMQESCASPCLQAGPPAVAPGPRHGRDQEDQAQHAGPQSQRQPPGAHGQVAYQVHGPGRQVADPIAGPPRNRRRCPGARTADSSQTAQRNLTSLLRFAARAL
jgi:hypothetical protein